MAFAKNADGGIYYASSGFYESNMVEAKYYDLYEYGENERDYTRSKLGDATGEVVGIASRNTLITSSIPFFRDYPQDGSILDCTAGYIRGGAGASRAVLIVP